MNILYLGSPTSYVTQNDLEFFTSMSHEVTVLDPFPRSPTIEVVKSADIVGLYDQRLLAALYSTIGGTFTTALLGDLRCKIGKIKEMVRRRNFDLIYAQWGANTIPLVKAIQKEKLEVPILYNFLSYPQNVYRWKVSLENWYCRRPIENLDGRIHANTKMYDYMDRHFNLGKHGIDIVVPPFFSRKYFFRKRLPLLSEHDGTPHLVFVGPVNSRWDDIRSEICGIMKEKVHFHMAKPALVMKENRYLHFFPYFPLQHLIDGSLATFMTQFDACIVTFNFKVCSNGDRFRTSFPSRFLFALTAGIPIVMPKGYLPACEEFLNEHQIGFTYRTLSQLRTILDDYREMQKLRENAINKTKDFNYEKDFDKLNNLVKYVTRQSSGN